MHGPQPPSSNKSTNVRSSFGAGLSRVLLAAGSRLAPRLTARWAERVFLTPGRRPMSERERELLSSGHRFTVRLDGRRIAAWSWGDGPTVFLVHGWGSRAARLAPFVDPLIRAGFSVVAFDAPGHGDSDGKLSSAVEIARALRVVADWTGAADAARGHAGIIAHSFGGPAAALAIRRGLAVKRAVFLSAPADLESPSRRFGEGRGIPPRVMQLLQERVEQRLGLRWRELALPNLAPPSTPLLVVHDTEDSDVPLSDAVAIAASWPGAELVTTTGLGHRGITQDAAVIGRVVAFVGNQVSLRRRKTSMPAARANQTQRMPKA